MKLECGNENGMDGQKDGQEQHVINTNPNVDYDGAIKVETRHFLNNHSY